MNLTDVEPSVLDLWAGPVLDEPAAPVAEPEILPTIEPKPYWAAQTEHAATALTVAAMATGGVGMGVGVVDLNPITTLASVGLAFVGYRSLAYLRRNR